MIELVIKDNEFSYDVKALALSFFPEEPCIVTQDRTILEKGEEGVLSGYPVRCYFDRELLFEEYIPKPYDKNIVKQIIYRHFVKKSGKTLPWGTLTGIRPAKISLRLKWEGKTPEEIRKELKTVFYCNDDKINLMLDVAEREYYLAEGIDHSNCYSLYIAIPFCPTRCHYCSFAAYPIKQYEKRVDEYLDALEKEMAAAEGAFPKRRLTSIYIGGGTPTSLSAEQLERLLWMTGYYFPQEEALEYTVEAGRPDSITREKLFLMKKNGVTRISINPQTMKQKTLEIMGREHTVFQVEEVFWLARELGFDNINMDLILGLPEEDLDDFKETLRQIEKLDPDSITMHTLVIKRASKMREEQMAKDSGLIAENDMVPQMLEYGQAFAYENGYAPYYMYRQKNKAGLSKNTNQENIAYAKVGKECLYNVFIMEELETILALGAGSSSKIVFPEENRMERVEKVKSVEEYIARIDEMIARTAEYIK